MIPQKGNGVLNEDVCGFGREFQNEKYLINS
jgi:hypothetical protein